MNISKYEITYLRRVHWTVCLVVSNPAPNNTKKFPTISISVIPLVAVFACSSVIRSAIIKLIKSVFRPLVFAMRSAMSSEIKHHKHLKTVRFENPIEISPKQCFKKIIFIDHNIKISFHINQVVKKFLNLSNIEQKLIKNLTTYAE